MRNRAVSSTQSPLLPANYYLQVPSQPVAAQYVVTFLKPEMLHVYRQITALREFRPVVLCQKRECADQFPFEDVQILPKPWSHQIRRFWQKSLLGRPITIYQSEARRILATLRTIEARLIHIYFGHIGVHLLPLLDLLAAEQQLAVSRRIPAIVSFHGADADVDFDQPAHRDAICRVFERASVLLVRSESLAERLRDHGAPSEKIRLHRTGIPREQIAFKQRRSPDDGAWRLLQSCRLITKKGLITSLRAFAEFSRTFPKACLTIAGEGPQLPELTQLASELGISERVNFTGFVSQPELRGLEYASHIFLHPSERGPDGDQEGVPNAMLEAMASGLPVAATFHGGIPEAVEDRISGYLVPERDSNALAQALLQMASAQDELPRMSKAAAERVAAEFDSKLQANRLEQIYHEVVD